VATDLLLGFALASLLALIALRWGALSKSGALATIVIGTIIFSLGGWHWFPAVLFFFLSSSLLSKFGKGKKARIMDSFQKNDRRDWAQVVANGLVPSLCVVFDLINPQPLWYSLYLTSLSAANADTWATELGILSSSTPILITSGRPVPAGTSGGISWIGTGASLAGAMSLALAGALLWPVYSVSLQNLVIITGAGFLASFFDSFLGATAQGQFACPACGIRTERSLHCGNQTKKLSGRGWVNNDLVNFLAGLFAAALTFFLIKV
jgi:uncharacterized protein (TIGR00297 family)